MRRVSKTAGSGSSSSDTAGITRLEAIQASHNPNGRHDMINTDGIEIPPVSQAGLPTPIKIRDRRRQALRAKAK
jgi:hypothetical protein